MFAFHVLRFTPKESRLGGGKRTIEDRWSDAEAAGLSGLDLLVAWVAAFAIIRGVTNIVMAFRVREVQHAGPG